MTQAGPVGNSSPSGVSYAQLTPDQQKRLKLASISPQELAAMSPDALALLLEGPIGRPPSSAAVDTGHVTLALEASVNGTDTQQIITIDRDSWGALTAKAGELRAIRIKVDPKYASMDAVAIADLPGVTAKIDEASQSIALHVPDALLATFKVGLGGDRQPVDLSAIRPTPGAIVNYSIGAWGGAGDTSVSGSVEAIGMTRFGIFSSSGIFDSKSSYGGHGVVRLDTSWQFLDAARVRSYMIGDFYSNALSWTSSVRLAGFQIASAFEQRPDLVTNALPQFSGSAALPSTLDLFVNQQRIFSGEIPAGPFDLKSLPYVSGGDVRLVTTDATGHQVTMTKAYYYVAGQLKQGNLQYSLDVGAPRLNYAIDSFDYDDTVFASGSVRYGVTDRLTVQGHAEGSADGLVNGGGGIVTTIDGRGAITASVAGSHYKGQTGALVDVQVEGQLAGIHAFAGTQRTFGDYMDLGRVASIRQIEHYRATSTADAVNLDTLDATARATVIDRAGLSFTPWFDKTSFSLSYNRIKSNGYDQRLANLSMSRSLSSRASFYVNGYKDFDSNQGYGIYATLVIRLGSNVSASAGIDHSGGRTGYTMQITGAADRSQNTLGWGVTDREYGGGDSQRSAYADYRAPQALLHGEVDEYGGQVRGSARIDGSIVAAGGGVFLANRIGNGFAIVRDAGPGVEISQGGAPIARTNGSGTALIADIIPYDPINITVDPTNLPDGWDLPTTEQTAVAPYRQGVLVNFGARRIQAAIVTLRNAAGKAIEPGYVATLPGGSPATIGYDGEVYLSDLKPENHVTVDLGPAGTCSADFAYTPVASGQARIGPVTCR